MQVSFCSQLLYAYNSKLDLTLVIQAAEQVFVLFAHEEW